MTTDFPRVFCFGDHIDTDRIIPGKYTKTLDTLQLARHAFEDADPGFAAAVRPGDIVVAGLNFGCGSSREQAPLAVKAAGIALVVARSFARIFFRNAINVGLPLMEIPDHALGPSSLIKADVRSGLLIDHRDGCRYHSEPLPKFLADILAEGGLVPYMRARGADAFQGGTW